MDFIGNQKTHNLLTRSIKNGSLNHAYIFSGPEHVGKFTLAKMFALHVISGTQLAPEIDDFGKEALLDLIVISPEVLEKKGVSRERDISIESIREAKQKLSLFPYHGRYKIMIINDAHKLNIAAQNAMLKILEEPNSTTMIILVTHEIDSILPTLQSRSQMMNFALASDAEMENVFPKDVVALAAGRPGLARIINENENERIFRSEAAKDMGKITAGSLNEKFVLAEEFSKDIARTLDKLDIWTWEMRKKALASDDSRRRKAYADMEKIQKSMDTLKHTNANARLVLETLFMDL